MPPPGRERLPCPVPPRAAPAAASRWPKPRNTPTSASGRCAATVPPGALRSTGPRETAAGRPRRARPHHPARPGAAMPPDKLTGGRQDRRSQTRRRQVQSTVRVARECTCATTRCRPAGNGSAVTTTAAAGRRPSDHRGRRLPTASGDCQASARRAGADLAMFALFAESVDYARARLQDAADQLIAQGYSYGDIGRELGITRQGARQRFGRQQAVVTGPAEPGRRMTGEHAAGLARRGFCVFPCRPGRSGRPSRTGSTGMCRS